MKKNRRLKRIVLLTSFVITLTLGLCVFFMRDVNHGSGGNTNVNVNQTERVFGGTYDPDLGLSGCTGIFEHTLVEKENDTKYGGEEGYAIITSIDFDGLVAEYPTFDPDNEYMVLEFPEYFIDNDVKYPVKEIDVPLMFYPGGTSGTFATKFVVDEQKYGSLSAQFISNVEKIIVPESVRYISYGAFNQFNSLVEIEVPFIGTQRGQVDRTIANVEPASDSFLALFGSVNHTGMAYQSDFSSTPQLCTGNFSKMSKNTNVINNQTGLVIDGLCDGYTNWYDYQLATYNPSIYDPKNSTEMVFPEHLKVVDITDEYNVPNHAFFYIPFIETISIQFSDELKTVGTSVTNGARIGISAFAASPHLKTIALPAEYKTPTDPNSEITSTISSFSGGVFRECYDLTTLTNYIDFKNGNYIQNEIHIPNTTPIKPDADATAKIYKAMFYECLSISKVILPTDVTAIEDDAFNNCTSLGTVAYKSYPNFDTLSTGDCIIPKYIEVIGQDAFVNCQPIQRLIVPSGVKEIGGGAFAGLQYLREVTLPFIGKSQGSTGDEGLFGYIFGPGGENDVYQNQSGDPLADSAPYLIPKNLLNVTITNETYVQSGAFMNCDMIKSLEIKDPAGENAKSSVYIGKAALAGCESLVSLSIPFVGPGDVTDYGTGGAYVNVNALPYGTRKDYHIGYIFGNYEYGGMAKTSYSGVTYYTPTTLQNVSLTHQTLLLLDSFYNLESLISVDVSTHTKAAERWVFGNNPNLTSVSVPFVGIDRGFHDYDYWVQGYYHSEYERFANSFAYLFRFNRALTYGDTYQTAPESAYHHVYYNWWYYSDNFKSTVPKSLKSIRITDETYFTTLSFRGLGYVEDIVITNDIDGIKSTHIEGSLFAGCTSLQSLEIPFIGANYNNSSKDGTSYTMAYMFGNGTSGYTVKYSIVNNNGNTSNVTASFPKNLTRITVSDAIKHIPAYAFYGMQYLTSVETQATISSMGKYCFAECPILEIVEMPNASYAILPEGAFYNDVRLRTLDDFTPVATMTTIGAYSLAGTSISTVDFSRYSKIGKGAFSNCLQITTVDFTNAPIGLTLGTHIFSKCYNLKNVTLKQGMISDYMFEDCRGIKDLNLDGITTYIPKGFLSGCTGLTDGKKNADGTISGLYMPVDTCGVIEIKEAAFMGCTGLTNFELPSTLVTIGPRAFQNCTGLEKIRIPRLVEEMVTGSLNNGNANYSSGIFYGCRDEFYLEVYLEEEDWPAGWKTNWNCFYPVITIGSSTEQMFTYAYSTELKGYLITGLNVYNATTNPSGFKFMTSGALTLSGTLVFPDSHNGVKVYGLAKECFKDLTDSGYESYSYVDNYGSTPVRRHFLENIDTFVMSSNFKYIGKNALIFDTSESIFREVYHKVSASNALTLSTEIDCGKLIYENDAEKDAKQDFQSKHTDLVDPVMGCLYYDGDNETEYIENAIIYYSDAWQYVTDKGSSNARIAWKITALEFELNSTQYTYALGAEIKPNIISVKPKTAYIKYTDYDYINMAEKDRMMTHFYSEPDNHNKNGLDVNSNLRIEYKNNINVGTGRMEITPINSNFTSKTTLLFTIGKYVIDVGYESGYDESAFGVDEYGTTLSALDHFINIIKQGIDADGRHIMINWTNNYATYKESLRTVRIAQKTYDEEKWYKSSWTPGQDVFVPTGYVFKGVLTTTSQKAGYYIRADKNDLYDYEMSQLVGTQSNFSDEIIQYAPGGFKWASKPQIIKNGEDVTRNFTFNLNYAVYIAPYEINGDNLSWDGYLNPTTLVYEYEYTGDSIIPVPTVQNQNTYKYYDPKIKVTVNPSPAVYPSAVEYTATITSYDTRNFKFSNAILDSSGNYVLRFIVVNAKLHIKLHIDKYVIGETQPRVEFSFDNYFGLASGTGGAALDQAYTLEFKNLHNHTISGKMVSDNLSGEDWEKGLYTFDGTGKTFKWTGNPEFTIYNSGGNDCTQYFEVTYDVYLEIIYNTFNYCLSIYDDNPNIANEADKLHLITGADPTIGVISYTETDTSINITYGVDGYTHYLDVHYYNTFVNNNVKKTFKFDNTDYTRFEFKELKEDGYKIYLTLSKERYETATRNIVLTLVKSDYIFKDISKEYDREAIDAFDALIRKPADFDPSLVTFTYYNVNNTNTPIDAPKEIGLYVFRMTTTYQHSQWFNDPPAGELNSKNSMNFAITQRTITIKVEDGIYPYNSKDYDGLPWQLILNDSTASKYNLLPGDKLSGNFIGNSSEVGIYDSSVPGTFQITSWSVTNDTLAETIQTQNYKIVFDGVYEIMPLLISFTSSGTTVDYDPDSPMYHSIIIDVIKPVYNYKIYYSETSLPADSEGWQENKPYYMAPGTYTVYFKIEADNYKTEIGVETVIINAAVMEFDCSTVQTFTYDGFYHSLDIKLKDNKPASPDIYYAEIDPSVYGTLTPEDVAALPYTTTKPLKSDPGQYYFYVKVESGNYQSIIGVFQMSIVEGSGPNMGLNVLPLTTQYDGNYYGPIVEFTSSTPAEITPESVKVYFSTQTDPANWILVDLVDYDSANGKWMLGILKDATDVPVKVNVKIMYPNYNMIKANEVDVHITKMNLDLDIVGHNDVYNGHFHTVTLVAGPTCHKLEKTGTADEGSISYIYYFSDTLFVPLVVKYGTTYIPSVGPVGFSTSMIREKNVCDKTVYLEVSGDNCNSIILEEKIVITKNANPTVTLPTSPFEIEYLARNIKYSDLSITTEHDSVPSIKWYDRSNGLEITNTKYLGNYTAVITYPDSPNCAEKTVSLDFDVIPRVIKVVYDKEVEYTGLSNNLPKVYLSVDCTDPSLLADMPTYADLEIDYATDSTIIPNDYTNIGQHKLSVAIQNSPMEYVLDTNEIVYDIVKKKLYVSFDLFADYNGSVEWTSEFTFSYSHTSEIPDGVNVSGLIANGDSLHIKFTASDVSEGTYSIQKTLQPNANDVFNSIGYINYLNVEAEVIDTNGDKVIYYQLVLDCKVTIQYPPIDVEVEPLEVDFDNNYHSLNIKVNSLGAGSFDIVYWLEGSTEITNSFSRKDVGEYIVNFKVIPKGMYREFVGQTTLTIKKAKLRIEIDPFENKIYNMEKYYATHTVMNDNFIQLPDGTAETLYYNPDSLGFYDKTDLDKFYQDGCPTTSPLYKYYQTASKYVMNAGDYYVYVRYLDDRNYYESFGTTTINVKRRPLYMKNESPNQPLFDSKVYNGLELEASLLNFTYDAANPNNNQPYTGFVKLKNGVPAHAFVGSFGDFKFMTSSPNCKIDGSNNVIPYCEDGDFLFTSDTNIVSASEPTVNLYNNYYPVFEPLSNGAYSVQLTIERASLTRFNLYDQIDDEALVFDGKDKLPRVETPSDGELYYFYKRVYVDQSGDIHYVDGGATIYNGEIVTDWTLPSDVTAVACYYEVYVSIGMGTNYYAWDGVLRDDFANPILDANGQPIIENASYEIHPSHPELNGLTYKKAYVEVIPVDTEIQWREGELEDVYDGQVKVIKNAYFMDVATGKKVPVDYQIIDANGKYVEKSELYKAGSYTLNALIDLSSVSHFGPENYNFVNKEVTYTILKRAYEVEEKIVEDYAYTNWRKQYTEADYGTIITGPEWLPGHTLKLNVSTVSDVSGKFYLSSHFDKYFTVTTETGDVTDSFAFDLNLSVLLNDGRIRYTTTTTDVFFNNQYHYPNVQVLSHVNNHSIKYITVNLRYDEIADEYVPMNGEENDVTKLGWSEVKDNDKPKLLNVGLYRVYFQITVKDGTPVYDYVDVYIRQSEAYINFTDLGLDRVYTGTARTEPEIKEMIAGGFNGSNADLIFMWFDANNYLDVNGEVDESKALPSQPKDVGRYILYVTSAADSNPNLEIKNYRELKAVYEYEITKADLILTIDSHFEVENENELSDPTKIATWNRINKLQQNEYANENGFNSRMVGLKGTDEVTYSISFAGTEFVRTIPYIYSNMKTALNPLGDQFLTDDSGNYLFSFSWSGEDSSGNDVTQNYDLYINFKLVVHYPYITVNEMERTFEYDPSVARYLYDGTNVQLSNASTKNLIYIQVPNVSGLTHGVDYVVEYKTVKSSNVWTSCKTSTVTDPGITAPGRYTIYYRIRFMGTNYYEDYEDSVKMTIKHVQRQAELTIVADDLVYDGTDLTGQEMMDNGNIQINFINPAQTGLETYRYEFYNAIKSGTDWIETGDPMEKVINAGNYILHVIIEEDSIYAETDIYAYFRYTPRNAYVTYTGTTPITTKYSGSNWMYDLVNSSAGLFTVTNLVNSIEAIHTLKKAVLLCEYTNVGTYTAADMTIRFDKAGDQLIVDHNNEDVTQNYVWIIEDFSLEIEKDEVTLIINPNYDKYTYPGNGKKITPKALVINPSSAQSMVEYTTDNTDDNSWSTNPIDFTDVGVYTLYVRLINVPNYEPYYTDYTFEIERRANEIEFTDLSKVFDNNAVTYPGISTASGYVGLADPSLSVDGADGTMSMFWQYLDVDGVFKPYTKGFPTGVGTYRFNLNFPQHGNYGATGDFHEFTISPLEISITTDVSQLKLEYNTYAQSPNYSVIKNADGIPISYLINGTDYTITYYNADNYDPTDITAQIAEPVNVGTYVMHFELINDGLKNVSFDLINSETTYALTYQIVPRKVKLEYAISHQNVTDITQVQVTAAELHKTDFPANVEFLSGVQPYSIIDGIYTFTGIYDPSTGLPSDMLAWIGQTTSGDPILYNNEKGINEDLANYELFINISISISIDEFSYEVIGFDGDYDGKEHSIKFRVTLIPEQFDWIVKYFDKQSNTWITTDLIPGSIYYEMPTFTDVTPIPERTLVQVLVYTEGTSQLSSLYPDPIILGDNPLSANYNKFTVNINPIESTVELAPDAVVGKIYDGTPINDPKVQYNTKEANENRDSDVEYKYYRITSTLDNAGNLITSRDLVLQSDVVNAGDYEVEISMKASLNFKACDPIVVPFAIEKRKVFIYVEGSKVFDGQEWENIITNANVKDYTSIYPESGLVLDHMIDGKLLTESANAKEYKNHMDFKWFDEYRIFEDSTNLSVKENYDVSISGDVKIEKADLKFEALGVATIYTGDLYGITINFLETPHASFSDSLLEFVSYAGLTKEEAENKVVKNYKDTSIYRKDNYLYDVGSYTVYFMIDVPNYNVIMESRKVIIEPINTSFIIDGFVGNAQDKVYDGLDYMNGRTISYQIAGSNEYTRIPSWRFYLASDPSTMLTYIPTNAGEYLIEGYVEATPDGVYSEQTSNKYSFKITPRPLTVLWKDSVNGVNALVTDLHMLYTGESVNPIPYMVDDVNTTAIKEDLLSLEVLLLGGHTETIISGYEYECQARLVSPQDRANFTLTPEKVKYVIDMSGPSPNPDEPGSDVLEPELDPTKEYVLESIKFIGDADATNPIYQGDPDLDPTGYTIPFKHGEEVVIVAEATFVCNDVLPKERQTRILIFTVDDSGNITAINGKTATMSNINIKVDYDNILTDDKGTTDRGDDIHYYKALAHLIDNNSTWDGTKSDDITIHLSVELLNPTTNGYTVTVSPKSSTHQIGDDPTKPIIFDVTVTLTKYDENNDPVEEIVIPEYADAAKTKPNFIVDWYNNVGATTDAHFNVRSVDGSGYSFVIGNYADPVNPAKDNIDPTLPYAGDFIIKETLPSMISVSELAEHIHFRKYEIGTEGKNKYIYQSWVSYDDRIEFNKTNTNKESVILLAGLHQDLTLEDLLCSLDNPRNRFKIYANNGDNGDADLIYNGKDLQLGDPKLEETLTVSKGKTVLTNAYKVRTGLRFVLYEDETHAKESDFIVTILYGDAGANSNIATAANVNIHNQFFKNKVTVIIDFSSTSTSYLNSICRFAAKNVGLSVVTKDDTDPVKQAYSIVAVDVNNANIHFKKIGSLKTNPSADRSKIDINHLFYPTPKTT